MKTDAMLGRCYPAMDSGLGLGPKFFNSDFGQHGNVKICKWCTFLVHDMASAPDSTATTTQ